MKKRYLISIISLVVLSIVLSLTFISATCSVTFDKDSYLQGETVTADMVCTSSTEKSKAYTLTWTNETGDTEETDLGTTPSTTGQHFFESFTISSGWSPGVWVNATLTGSNLEGEDSANVTASAGATNSLIITKGSVEGLYLGLISSLDATVTDEGLKTISGGVCRIDIEDNTGTQDVIVLYAEMINGDIDTAFILNYESFAENTDYIAEISCWCGSDGSSNECIDEDGTAVENSVGTTSVGFTTNTWMTVNTMPFPNVYVNGSDYPNAIAFAGFGENIYYFANITNNHPGILKIQNTPVLINNDTGNTFSNGGGVYSAPVGNNTYVIPFEISNAVPTGQYYITNYFDVYYSNILVTQGIVDTEVFNVTGTDDSFKLENVLMDKDSYYIGESAHVCINLTNDFDTRVEFEVLYNFRCGEDNSDSSTERSLVGEHFEFRALSGGTTQNQCAELPINFVDHLKYKTTQCYASVTIKSPYIDTFDNKKSITGSVFNVTDYGMYPDYELNPDYPIVRLFPDWRRFDDVIDGVSRSYYRAKINVTKLEESKLDPNDNIADDDWDIYATFSDTMPCSDAIYNYTVLDASGNVVDNEIESKAITWRNGDYNSRCALGIEEVNFSDTDDDYFEVRVWFEDFDERQTEALEGIENKTGTFHLDVECPTFATIDEAMSCQITAYIEDSQEIEKEVDFTCYISEGGEKLSSLNFNKMVTKTPWNISKEFLIPSTFLDSTSHTLQCHANYYNLGSRQDSFYDTFVSVESPPQGTIGAGAVTGDGIVDKIKDKTDEIIDKVAETTKKIKDKLFSSAMWIIGSIVGGLVFIFLIILIIVLATKKKKKE